MHDTKMKDHETFTLVKFTRKLRKTMYRDANYTCQCCGEKRTSQNKLVLTLHHIVPRSFGGLGTAKNALVCCIKCHVKIHQYIKGLQQTFYNFWEDLKSYILSLPKSTKKCKKRFLVERAPQKYIDYIVPVENLKEAT